MNAVEIASSDSSSSSRHGSSSPGASPSRSSTPSQSSASSDFLPSDNVPLTPWTPYVKPEPSGLFDDDMKPSFDAAYYGIGMPEHGGFHGPSPRGMLLEDLMQEDAYESAPFDSMLHQSTTPATPTVIPAFEPALPNLPAYPSPSPSTSEASPQPSTVQVPASQATVRQTSARGQGSIKPDVRHAFESSSLQTLLVTTPNASCPNAPIQSPPRHSVSSLPILIHNVPAVGAKSRVETQIKMTLDLAAPHDGMAAYDRIGSWKWLRLPKGTSTRRRPRKEPKIDAHPDDTLNLSVAVTCASDPSMPVSACTNCLAREAKRIERKKAARVRPQRHDSSDSEDEGAVFRVPTGPDGKALPPKDGEGTGIVVFNCPEINDFSEGRVVLPVRVTCYCRHHREKMGFRIAFTMADANGRVVGRGSTPPIMITDDHKSVVKVTPQAPPPEEEEIQPAKRKRRLARDPDPVEVEREPRAKRRAKEQTPPSSVPSAASTPQASGTSFFPQQYSQRFDSSPRFTHPSAHASQSPSTFTTAPSSPIISALNAPSPSGSGVFLHYPVTNEAQLPPTAKPSITLNESHYLPPVDELEALQSLASASSVASPVSVHDIAQVPAASIFSTLTAFGTAPPEGPNPGPSPQIHRLIPSSGPTHGGIEVTVLGSNFMPTLRCVFGDTVAASTQMWSETTLVCLLPPSATPGPVVVSFEGMPLAVGGGAGPGANGQGLQLFNYLDNSDRALMELALQVVGLKMTGRIEEAKDVAMRIVGTSSSSGDGGDAGVAGGSMSTYTTLSGSAVDGDVVHTALHGADSQASGSSTRDFQSVIIEFLKLLDVEVPTTSRVTVEEAVSLASPSGQTLLHLSAILGFHRLLKHLVSRGIDLDVRDANGYTALHFAALCGRVACARILVEGGADIEIVDARGRLAREVAQWRDQVDVQDLLESFEHRAARSDVTTGHSTGSDDADESELGDDSEYMSSAEDSDDWNVASPTATIKPEPVEVEDDFNLSDHEDVADGNEPAAPVRPITGPEDSKFPPEKSLLSTSEKNPQSLLHRTLSQLPTAGLPNLPPMPDFFPNMPGLPMPQWALPNQLQLPNLHLPDIPLVFPVQMPTPSWPAVLQWSQPSTPTAGDAAKRSEGGFAVLPSGALPSWLSSYPWLAASGASTPSAEKEQDPPMYTPPAPSTSSAPLVVPLQSASTSSDSIPREESVLPAGTESGNSVITSLSRAGSSSMLHSRPKSSRRQAHTAAEREQRLHDFQIKLKKQEQDKLKSDRMLIFFWIPVLILVFVYGVYVGVPALISGARNAADAYHTLRKQLTPA